MKSALRSALFVGAISFLVLGSSASGLAQSGASACTRDSLINITNNFFSALEAHNPSAVQLASDVKYT
ncbi:MAG: hypothetical protein P8Z37_10715, partial [Acidobacteriota bacterium]